MRHTHLLVCSVKAGDKQRGGVGGDTETLQRLRYLARQGAVSVRGTTSMTASSAMTMHARGLWASS